MHVNVLHIVCRCKYCVLLKAMVDNESALCVYLLSTLKQMKEDLSLIRANLKEDLSLIGFGSGQPSPWVHKYHPKPDSWILMGHICQPEPNMASWRVNSIHPQHYFKINKWSRAGPLCLFLIFLNHNPKSSLSFFLCASLPAFLLLFYFFLVTVCTFLIFVLSSISVGVDQDSTVMTFAFLLYLFSMVVVEFENIK